MQCVCNCVLCSLGIEHEVLHQYLTLVLDHGAALDEG